MNGYEAALNSLEVGNEREGELCKRHGIAGKGRFPGLTARCVHSEAYGASTDHSHGRALSQACPQRHQHPVRRLGDPLGWSLSQLTLQPSSVDLRVILLVSSDFPRSNPNPESLGHGINIAPSGVRGAPAPGRNTGAGDAGKESGVRRGLSWWRRARRGLGRSSRFPTSLGGRRRHRTQACTLRPLLPRPERMQRGVSARGCCGRRRIPPGAMPLFP